MPIGFWPLIPAALLLVVDLALHGEWLATAWRHRKMIREHKREVSRL